MQSIWSVPNFRLYLAARFLGSLALQMVAVAVGWQVYQLTNDPLHLGYVGLVQFVPNALFVLAGGHVADRFDRRKVMIACLAVEGVAVVALLAFSLAVSSPLPAIYAVLAVMGGARAFLAPASQSLLPLLVKGELFPRAVAWNSTAWEAAVIAGPALGGLLYAFGAGAVYGTAAAMMAAAVGALAGVRTPPAAERKPAAGLEGVLGGVRYVAAHPILLGAISLDLFAVLLGGATALLPVYARDILVTGPFGLGLLRSAPAVGAAVMAVWLAHHPLERAVGTKLFVAVAVFGAATLVFGLSTSFWLSLAALAVLGASDMVSMVVRQTVVQLNTPDAMRGRVSAVNWLFIGASNELGEFESGLTAAWFGTVPAVVIGGLGTLAVTALWAWRFPALRTVDRLHKS